MKELNQRFEFFVRILGFSLLAIYFVTTTGMLNLPDAIPRVAMFLLSPVAILVVLIIYRKHKLKEEYRSIQKYAVTFFIIAFSIANLMLTMQQAILYYFKIATTESPLKQSMFTLINGVQLGADISFDIFYSLGILLYAVPLVLENGLDRITGGVGIIASLGLLTLNFIAFPTPPAEQGWVDLGPVTLVWWVLLIICIRRKNKTNEAN